MVLDGYNEEMNTPVLRESRSVSPQLSEDTVEAGPEAAKSTAEDDTDIAPVTAPEFAAVQGRRTLSALIDYSGSHGWAEEDTSTAVPERLSMEIKFVPLPESRPGTPSPPEVPAEAASPAPAEANRDASPGPAPADGPLCGQGTSSLLGSRLRLQWLTQGPEELPAAPSEEAPGPLESQPKQSESAPVTVVDVTVGELEKQPERAGTAPAIVSDETADEQAGQAVQEDEVTTVAAAEVAAEELEKPSEQAETALGVALEQSAGEEPSQSVQDEAAAIPVAEPAEESETLAAPAEPAPDANPEEAMDKPDSQISEAEATPIPAAEPFEKVEEQSPEEEQVPDVVSQVPLAELETLPAVPEATAAAAELPEELDRKQFVHVSIAPVVSEPSLEPDNQPMPAKVPDTITESPVLDEKQAEQEAIPVVSEPPVVVLDNEPAPTKAVDMITEAPVEFKKPPEEVVTAPTVDEPPAEPASELEQVQAAVDDPAPKPESQCDLVQDPAAEPFPELEESQVLADITSSSPKHMSTVEESQLAQTETPAMSAEIVGEPDKPDQPVEDDAVVAVVDETPVPEPESSAGQVETAAIESAEETDKQLGQEDIAPDVVPEHPEQVLETQPEQIEPVVAELAEPVEPGKPVETVETAEPEKQVVQEEAVLLVAEVAEQPTQDHESQPKQIEAPVDEPAKSIESEEQAVEDEVLSVVVAEQMSRELASQLQQVEAPVANPAEPEKDAVQEEALLVVASEAPSQTSETQPEQVEATTGDLAEAGKAPVQEEVPAVVSEQPSQDSETQPQEIGATVVDPAEAEKDPVQEEVPSVISERPYREPETQHGQVEGSVAESVKLEKPEMQEESAQPPQKSESLPEQDVAPSAEPEKQAVGEEVVPVLVSEQLSNEPESLAEPIEATATASAQAEEQALQEESVQLLPEPKSQREHVETAISESPEPVKDVEYDVAPVNTNLPAEPAREPVSTDALVPVTGLADEPDKQAAQDEVPSAVPEQASQEPEQLEQLEATPAEPAALENQATQEDSAPAVDEIPLKQASQPAQVDAAVIEPIMAPEEKLSQASKSEPAQAQDMVTELPEDLDEQPTQIELPEAGSKAPATVTELAAELGTQPELPEASLTAVSKESSDPLESRIAQAEATSVVIEQLATKPDAPETTYPGLSALITASQPLSHKASSTSLPDSTPAPSRTLKASRIPVPLQSRSTIPLHSRSSAPSLRLTRSSTMPLPKISTTPPPAPESADDSKQPLSPMRRAVPSVPRQQFAALRTQWEKITASSMAEPTSQLPRPSQTFNEFKSNIPRPEKTPSPTRTFDRPKVLGGFSKSEPAEPKLSMPSAAEAAPTTSSRSLIISHMRQEDPNQAFQQPELQRQLGLGVTGSDQDENDESVHSFTEDGSTIAASEAPTYVSGSTFYESQPDNSGKLDDTPPKKGTLGSLLGSQGQKQAKVDVKDWALTYPPSPQAKKKMEDMAESQGASEIQLEEPTTVDSPISKREKQVTWTESEPEVPKQAQPAEVTPSGVSADKQESTPAMLQQPQEPTPTPSTVQSNVQQPAEATTRDEPRPQSDPPEKPQLRRSTTAELTRSTASRSISPEKQLRRSSTETDAPAGRSSSESTRSTASKKGLFGSRFGGLPSLPGGFGSYLNIGIRSAGKATKQARQSSQSPPQTPEREEAPERQETLEREDMTAASQPEPEPEPKPEPQPQDQPQPQPLPSPQKTSRLGDSSRLNELSQFPSTIRLVPAEDEPDASEPPAPDPPLEKTMPAEIIVTETHMEEVKVEPTVPTNSSSAESLSLAPTTSLTIDDIDAQTDAASVVTDEQLFASQTNLAATAEPSGSSKKKRNKKKKKKRSSVSSVTAEGSSQSGPSGAGFVQQQAISSQTQLSRVDEGKIFPDNNTMKGSDADNKKKQPSAGFTPPMEAQVANNSGPVSTPRGETDNTNDRHPGKDSKFEDPSALAPSRNGHQYVDAETEDRKRSNAEVGVTNPLQEHAAASGDRVTRTGDVNVSFLSSQASISDEQKPVSASAGSESSAAAEAKTTAAAASNNNTEKAEEANAGTSAGSGIRGLAGVGAMGLGWRQVVEGMIGTNKKSKKQKPKK